MQNTKLDRYSIVKQYLDNGKGIGFVRSGEKIPQGNWNSLQWINHTHEEYKSHKGNFGWQLGPRDLIIDVDIKNGNKGEQSITLLKQDLNKIDPNINICPTVITPSGGTHYYFTLPEDFKGAICVHLKRYPGLEFYTRQEQVLIPPSRKRINGEFKYYRFVDDRFFQDPIPQELLDLLTIPNEPIPSDASLGEKKAPLQYIEDMLAVIYPDTLSYNEWLHIGMSIHHGYPDNEGLTIWDKWSQNDTRYKSGECEQKWRGFHQGHGVTLGTLCWHAKQNGYKPPSDNTDFMDYFEDLNKEMFYKDWCLLGNEYVNIHQSQEKKTWRQFDTEFKYHIRPDKKGNRVKPTSYVEGLIPTVTRCIYHPLIEQQITKIDGITYLNTFCRKYVPQAAEELTAEGKAYIDFVRQHIRNLFGEEERAVIFEQWLAHQVQNPGKLLRWAPIIQGNKGMGKTFFSDLLQSILGDANVGGVKPGGLLEKYNKWAIGSLVVVFEEVKLSGHNRHEIFNEINPVITNKIIKVRQMHTNEYKVPNVTNYMLLTNFKDAVPLDDGDRRYWIIFCKYPTVQAMLQDMGMSEYDYFTGLFEGLDKYGPEVHKWLLEYEITQDFIRLERAPLTEERQQLIENEKDKITGWLECEEIIKEGLTYSVTPKAFIHKALFMQLEKRFNISLSLPEEKILIKKLGFVLRNRRTNKGGFPDARLYTLEHVTEYTAFKVIKQHNKTLTPPQDYQEQDCT